jgi:hypothetical protein
MPDSLRPLHAGSAWNRLPLPSRQAGGQRATAGQAGQSLRPRLLITIYVIALPLWWVLGVDFAMPLLLASALFYVSPATHRDFTASDHLLVAIIVVMGSAAYLNGFLIGRHTLRFAAALYNLSIWVCGLVVLQQARSILLHGSAGREAALRAGLVAFLTFAAVAWGSFIGAYALGEAALEAPSLFGMTAGDLVPASAALIKQSMVVVFTRPDWGLPGVEMPRIVVYGPYPTATAAVTAVLGTLALLHLQGRGKGQGRGLALAGMAIEALILLTLAITLTRSILAGWLLGAVAAALIFGTAWRRILAVGALAVAIPLSFHVDLSGAADYRGYSTESRFENYDRAVGRTLDHNPILGLGVKPREQDNHIAVGSHSTFVSSFTKSGTLGLSLVVAYLVLLPAYRWLGAIAGASRRSTGEMAELRILFNLQVALWVWLCFEDIDAPATAAMLIFLAFALIEVSLRIGPRGGAGRRAGRLSDRAG